MSTCTPRGPLRPGLAAAAGLVLVGLTAAPALSVSAPDGPRAPRYATTVVSPGPIDPAALPLGDGYVSTTPRLGYVDSCQTSFGAAGGATVDGPWIDTVTRTWDSLTKIHVEGAVAWPSARYRVSVAGSRRHVTTDDLPLGHTTGIFPIRSTDPAYAYDHNPNSIEAQSVSWSLPKNPTKAASPSCTPGGPIAVLEDGVLLFNALDGEGRDAVAHEVLDSCGEHPDPSGMLHHHDVPGCLLDKAKGRSTLVGYALDGFGIYVERNADGQLLTNTDLDACHGRVSEVLWDGREQRVFHYDATLEYPYTVGCFEGTPISSGLGPGRRSAPVDSSPRVARLRARVSPTSSHALDTVRPMGRPRISEEPRVTTAIRLPLSLHGELRREATARAVSINVLLTEVVSDFLCGLPPRRPATAVSTATAAP